MRKTKKKIVREAMSRWRRIQGRESLGEGKEQTMPVIHHAELLSLTTQMFEKRTGHCGGAEGDGPRD
jgi:hypothetical protein